MTLNTAWDPASPPALQDGAAGGAGGRGGPAGSSAAREEEESGREASGLSQGPVPEQHGSRGHQHEGARMSPPPSHSTHQEEGQGAGSLRPRPTGRRRRRWGQWTGRTAQEPAGTCPTHVPASLGLAVEVPASWRETLLGANPPQHPDSPPHAQTPGRREAGWDQAQGGPVAKGLPAEPPCSVAPREHPRSDDSGGSWHIPGPPSKPACWGDAARGGFSLPRRDSPG